MAFLSPSDIDPAAFAAITDISGNQAKKDELALQLRMATALRDKQPDHGTMAGQMYIPPNPLNQIMDNYDHIKGIIDSAGSGKKEAALDQQKASDLATFMQKYFNVNGNNQQDPGSSGLVTIPYNGENQ